MIVPQSDLWWLPKNVAIDTLLVGLEHHEVVTDDEIPLSLDDWYHSLDQDGNLSHNREYHPINSLNKWRSACRNTNVYRTLKVFDENSREAIFLGPFLIDIDNSNEDLEEAQAVTKQVLNYLIEQLRLPLEDIRLFFSGRKGFNLEVLPQAIGINGLIPNQIRLSSNKLNDIIVFLRRKNDIQDGSTNVVGSNRTVIERIYENRFGYKLKHPYIRFHNSINKWI